MSRPDAELVQERAHMQHLCLALYDE